MRYVPVVLSIQVVSEIVPKISIIKEHKILSPRDRILLQVEPIPESGCWIWMGKLNNGGYGRLGVHGQGWTAHRLSYTIFNGPIPIGMFVCHHCDIPSCVNPDHLFLGTPKDNALDASRKGRLKGNVPKYSWADFD